MAICEGKPPVTSGFSSQRASNEDRISMSWRHHEAWQQPFTAVSDDHIDSLVQNCNNSSASADELLQSCTKPSI